MSLLRFGDFAADMSELDYLGFGVHFPSPEPELGEFTETRVLIRDPATGATIDCQGAFDLSTLDTFLASHADWVELRTGSGALLFTWSGIRITMLEILEANGGGFLWEQAFRGEDLVSGSPQGDRLLGYDGGDTIEGNAGDDSVHGGDGDDRLDGGTGADQLTGGGGADHALGGEGDDTLTGDVATDTLDGGAGRDLLDGGLDDDWLDGGEGADTLIGTAGNDTLDGGAGSDLLRGGEGTDVARFDGGLGTHRITVTDPLAGRLIVADLGPDDSDDGQDSVAGIESIHFDDAVMQVLLPPASVPVSAPLTLIASIPAPRPEQSWTVFDDGSAVLVWREYDTGGGGIDLIRAQRFDVSLAGLGAPIEVARGKSTGSEHLFSPSVTPLADGGFAVAWTRSFYGADGYDEDTRARCFTPEGTAAGEAFDLSAGDGIQRVAKLAPDAGGGFVAVWFEGGYEGGIDARRFDPQGSPVGDVFEVSGAGPYGFEPSFDITTLREGALAVVWNPDPMRAGTTASPALLGRLIGSDGISSVTLDLDDATGYASRPVVSPLAEGGFAVAWSADEESVPIQTAARGVYVQRFDALGSRTGERIEAAPPSQLRSWDAPVLTGLRDGGFVVVWSDLDVLGRRFDADGAPIGAPSFVANPSRGFETALYDPATLSLADGDFLIAWTASANLQHRLQAQRFAEDWDPTRFTTVATGPQNDTLLSGGGPVRFAGGPGDDVLHGGDASDWLQGQDGIDTVVFRGWIDDYAFLRSGPTLRIADRVPGRDGTDRIDGFERLQFADVALNLTVRETAASVPGETLDRLCELYVGFFGRVPAANGLEHWIRQSDAGKPIDRIADDFYGIGSSPDLREFTGYWDFARDTELSNEDYVRIVYRNVLGREGRPEGIAYWTSQLDDNAKSRGSLVSTMLDSAHELSADPRWSWVPALLDDRTMMSKRIAVEWGLNYAIDAGDAITRGSAIAAAVRTEPNPDPALADIPVVIFDAEAAVALVGFDPSVLEALG